ncbi:cyclase family protein [Actinomadura mexicana]|uniref:Kynurenine formamidase n=1 Tax=Actinomadura mexicana TaxID=134959 RepID=A0A239A0V2_9ACTN|nr:cyclase family protein [Actinomadura mexicana]SNR89277.1 Kynurenine formamidase [Actinomadura mexicana]
MTSEDFRRVGAEVSNWGRWGAEDERGTLNLITPREIVRAARSVLRGAVFDLGIPLGADGPQAFPGRINPLHMMTETGARQEYPGGAKWSDDYVVMPLQAGTQWDAFAHVWYDGLLYNGFGEDAVGPHGAARCSIDALGNGIAGRGVLLDVARHAEVDWLEGGHVIGPETLDAVAERQGTEIRAGDIVLIRTGWWKKFVVERDAAGWMSTEPGLGLGCVRWIRAHDLAALGMDNWGIEVAPGEDLAVTSPVHCVLLRDVGIPLGEIFDLEALGEDCADDGVYEFLFVAPPLKVTGAVGSPVNPLALK